MTALGHHRLFAVGPMPGCQYCYHINAAGVRVKVRV